MNRVAVVLGCIVSACAGQRGRPADRPAPSDPIDALATPDAASDTSHPVAEPQRPRIAAIPRPRGTLRFQVRDARTSRPVAAHVAVRGMEGTPDPDLGPRHRADGAYQSRIAVTGEGTIPLPAGVYRVTFDRGIEWTIFQARIEITSEQQTALIAELSHAVPMDDWTSCDLHVHAERSFDSRVSIVDRVASLAAVGVEFATPTEHNVVGDYREGVRALPTSARGARGERGPGLAWVPAVEVTTDAAEYPIGHFNVFPYRANPRREHGGPPDFRASAATIFAQARANRPDAVIQVNHPRMETNIGYFTRAQLDPQTNTSPSGRYDPGYTAIELFNGYYLGVPSEVDRVVQDWLALLATGARYVGTANSDSHSIAYEAAGYPRTYVWTPRAGDASAPADVVLRSLRAGRAFGTSGPLLFLTSGRAGPGDTVRVPRGRSAVTVRVTVRAAPWIDVDVVELYRDTTLVATVAVPPSQDALRVEADVEIPVTAARHAVVALARGDRPLGDVLPFIAARPFAFTNPLWLAR